MQDWVFALGPFHFPTSAFTQRVCNVALLHCFLPSLVSRWSALLCWAVCRTWFGLVVMSTQQLPSAAGSAHLPYIHRWCKDMKVTWMTSWVEQTYQEDLDEIKDDNLMGYNMTPIYWMQGKNFQKFFFSKVQLSLLIIVSYSRWKSQTSQSLFSLCCKSQTSQSLLSICIIEVQESKI